MPKQHPQPGKKERRKVAKQQHDFAAICPAPFLQQKSLVLSDVVPLSPDANRQVQCLINGNGLSTPGVYQDRVPQQGIWDQYAAIFEYYQVTKITYEYVPYRFQGTTASDVTTVFPTFSIISPEAFFASSPTQSMDSAYLSFGNCVVKAPYQKQVRHIANYTDLAICKQEETILKTKGTSNNREKYTNPASIQMCTTAPSFTQNLSGVVIYTIHYVFSGQKGPDVVAALKPQPQSEDILQATNSSIQAGPTENDMNVKFQKFLANQTNAR